jgi:hypothetical protein
MKSFITCLFLTVIMCALSQAQDIKTAATFFDQGKLDKAKTAIDAALSGAEASKPKTWVWKHKIYYAIAQSNVYKNSTPNALQLGFEALKTARNMPKGDEALLMELGLEYNKPFNDYYTQFINNGSVKMNNGQFTGAFEEFKLALSVSHFFYEQKMIDLELDTMLTFYAGYCAMKANNPTGAEEYFKKLYNKSASGTDIQIAYGWLCNYYLETKKDAAAAKAVCDRGLLYYPTDEYLKSKQIEIARAGKNYEEIFKQYETNLSQPAAAFADYLSYGAELYDYLYVNDDNHSITNIPARETRMKEMLLKALRLKPESAEANYIFGMYYTNKALDSDKKLKNETDADKKNEMRQDANIFVASSVAYLEKTVALYSAKAALKTNENEHLKTALQQLVNLYTYQKEPADKIKAIKEKLAKL